MADAKLVHYLKTNLGKFPVESLKQALAKAGATPEQIDEALREASAPPSAPAPAPAPVRPPSQPAQPAAQPAQEPSQQPPGQPGSQQPSAQPAAEPAAGIDPRALMGTAKQVLLDPYGFFRSMPKEGGFREPLIFLLAVTVTAQVLGLVLGLGSGLIRGAGFVLLALIGGFFFGLILVPIVAAVAAAAAYAVWMVLGSKEKFETSFRCVAYMSAITLVHALVQWIPMVGMWLAIPAALYGLFLLVPASIEVHAVKKKTALIVFGVLAAIVSFSLIGSTYALWKLRRMAKSAAKGGPEAIAQLQAAARIMQGAGRVTPVPPMGGVQPLGRPGSGSRSAKENQIMAAISGGTDVKLTDHLKIKALLPETLLGLPRTELMSQKGGMGRVQVATARATYRAADGTQLRVEITDSGTMSGVLAIGFNSVEMDRRTEDGFERTLLYRGTRAKERFRTVSQRGSFETFVGDRFMVKLRGRKLPMETIREAYDSLPLEDIKKLAP